MAVLHLIVDVLRIRIGPVRAHSAHGSDGSAHFDMLSLPNCLRLHMEQLVFVSVAIPDRNRAVSTSHEHHLAGYGGVDCRVPEIDAGLASRVIEVGTAMGPLARISP